MNKPNTERQATVGWDDINWAKLERAVFKLQKRIYQASKHGDVQTVRKLQKTLMRSWSARLLAVRRVTQDNRGKKTAGVDGIKSIPAPERLQLAEDLSNFNQFKPKPVRRVWIPKPGKLEKRPLGIPTIRDRAAQALVKLALEPEWEAKFEPNSYGFRPGRSCHDAIGAIFISIHSKPKWVLDADISKCFDKIDHSKLLAKLGTFPSLRRAIKQWLKAGIIDWELPSKERYQSSESGTPQGGVISPLLANIALHGMETIIQESFPRMSHTQKETWFHQKGTQFNSPTVIRYADDFVVMHSDKRVVEASQEILIEWLRKIGLELKPEKTRITHTLEDENKPPGFDFLGFTIRQFKVKSDKNKNGFKTIIKPSKKAIEAHSNRVKEIIETYKDAPKSTLISKLNPIIRGWANYYRAVCSRDIYDKLDNLMFLRLRAWAIKRHRYKGEAFYKNWIQRGNQKWVFATPEGHTLLRYGGTKIARHAKVKGEKSPYDGDWTYWSARMGRFPGIRKQVVKLLCRNKGKCDHCRSYFSPHDILEVHHLDRNRKNNGHDNLWLIHGHCHDTLHGVGSKDNG